RKISHFARVISTRFPSTQAETAYDHDFRLTTGTLPAPAVPAGAAPAARPARPGALRPVGHRAGGLAQGAQESRQLPRRNRGGAVQMATDDSGARGDRLLAAAPRRQG